MNDTPRFEFEGSGLVSARCLCPGQFAAVRWLSRLLLVSMLMFAPPAWCESSVVLVFGDSLSAAYGIDLHDGWVSQLERRIDEHGWAYRVVNASISGDTTRGGLARLEDALQDHRPAVLVLELGGNDGLRGLPLEETRKNLAAMVQMAQAVGVKVLLAGMRLPPNFGFEYTGKFEQIYPDLARQYGTGLVPFLLDGVAGYRQYMQDDGIHPRAEGQERILDNVWRHLKPLLSRQLAAGGS